MFAPTKPADHSPLSSAELQTALTVQNNTIASLQAQLGALTADTSHNCNTVGGLS